MSAERQQLLAERQQLLAASEKRNNDWQGLKAKYIQKSSTLKEVGSASGHWRICLARAVYHVTQPCM